VAYEIEKVVDALRADHFSNHVEIDLVAVRFEDLQVVKNVGFATAGERREYIDLQIRGSRPKSG
jgi:hypothetical protein